MALLFLALNIISAQPSSVGQTNYTVAQANATIANVSKYISTINISSYLIFTPNLKSAYAYLSEAKSTYKTSPPAAVSYALQAEAAAQQAYGELGTYRTISFYAMVAFTIVAAVFLYVFMQPLKFKRKGRSRRKP